MNALQEQLFLELRQSKKEIESSLKAKGNNNWLTAILEDELSDICLAIEKIKKSKYGECEISGELIPENVLKMVPTARSLNDVQKLNTFCRKQL